MSQSGQDLIRRSGTKSHLRQHSHSISTSCILQGRTTLTHTPPAPFTVTVLKHIDDGDTLSILVANKIIQSHAVSIIPVSILSFVLNSFGNICLICSNVLRVAVFRSCCRSVSPTQGSKADDTSTLNRHSRRSLHDITRCDS